MDSKVEENVDEKVGEKVEDKQDTLEAALHALEVLFVSKLPAKFAEIEEALDQLVQNSANTETIKLLHRLLHTMAGSAGTFGFPEMGLQAKELETRIKPLLTNLTGGSWSDVELNQFASDVREFLSTSMHTGGKKTVTALSLGHAEEPVEASSSKLIYLVDDDPVANREVTLQLEQFGCEVVVITELHKLAKTLTERIPDVLVVDLGSPDSRFSGVQEITRIKQTGQLASPIIFTSNLSSFESRLMAVRAGGVGYFAKPIDITELTERIDALSFRSEPNGYRILIVDDDVDTSQYYAAILRDSGMNVYVLNTPADIFEIMAKFRPELLLMDVYMPICSGVELSKMIRQDNSFLDIPIVFLSREDNLEKQLDAVEVGADDFLTKPMVPKFLISAVSSCAERYRSLRALILRDGLTGLYNHTAIKEELNAEISIAGRNNTPLALAMLDLDNFKHVNDAYGHPVGDQVLRTLSLLLRQRLRRSDLVGRYGGEEFVVIFPGTTAATANKVLEKIRQAFFKIQQFSEKGDFSVSFSAGIADLTLAQNADELFDSADAALYAAKHAGKNRIVLSG